MKELIYNLRYLIRKKELYLAIIGFLFVNLIHIFLVIHYNSDPYIYYENWFRAEYLFILNNNNVSLISIIILAFPILSSTILGDVNWDENKQNFNNILHVRLNAKKLVIIRFFLIIFLIFMLNFLSFMLNYLVLRGIYGSGNVMTYFSSPAFYLICRESYFLDCFRLSNPFLYVIFISMHVSFIISLLAGLSYSISFWIKQKVIIYVIPFIVLIGAELILSVLNLNEYSLVTQLQPLSKFSLNNAIVVYFVLLFFSLFLICIKLYKKDSL